MTNPGNMDNDSKNSYVNNIGKIPIYSDDKSSIGAIIFKKFPNLCLMFRICKTAAWLICVWLCVELDVCGCGGWYASPLGGQETQTISALGTHIHWHQPGRLEPTRVE